MLEQILQVLHDMLDVFIVGYAEILYSIFMVITLGYFFLLNFTYLLTSIASYRLLKRYTRRLRSIDFDDLIATTEVPPITLFAPAFNEEASVVESVKSLQALNYPDYDIVVINDGSKDKTLEKLVEAFHLEPAAMVRTAWLETAEIVETYSSRIYPNIWVIDKQNGGKADALNAGINHCRTPVFCAMDADSVLERDALIRIIRPFLEDESTVAAGGIIRIANGCDIESGHIKNIRLPQNLLARFQVLEYLRAFLAGRMGWEALKAPLIISGAFGIFSRSMAAAAGGYERHTVGEDMELVVKLHKYCLQRKIPYRISFVPDPVAWTECPEKMRVLRRQRDRWQRGLYEVLSIHSDMLLRPKYKRIGMLAFPYFFFLEMMGPIIEVIGYSMLIFFIVTGRIGLFYPIAFFMLAFVFGTALSITTVGLEELTFARYERTRDLLRLFWLAIIENFGYRQIMTVWRFRGLISAIRGKKGWGKMERKGFASPKQKDRQSARKRG